MPDKTPQGLIEDAALDRLPPPTWLMVLLCHFRFQHSSVSGFPHQCLYSCIPYSHSPHNRSPLGLPGFSDVSLPACHGLRTPADLHTLANPGASVLPSVYVKTLGIRNKLMSKLYQHFRERDLPYGLQDSLSTLRPSCSSWITRLRQGRKTRYGWVANPYPTGTFTLQDTSCLTGRLKRWLVCVIMKRSVMATQNKQRGGLSELKRLVMCFHYNLSSSLGSTSGTFDIALRNDFLSPFNDLSFR